MKIILLLFLISTIYILVQHFKIVYLLSKHQKFKFDNQDISDPVSVIICAKNEEHNLSKNLKVILNQNYSEFEVVVVDDFSSDSTQKVLQKIQKKYPRLKIIQPKKKSSNSKRNALKTGVLAANYDLVLLTDADCRPLTKRWIQSMSASLSKDKPCVLGYSPYAKHASFLNYIIQCETLQTACLYFSRALAKKAYMSVGRNVMYTKTFFLDNENFENENELTSGDDDLLIQNVKDKSQITVNLNTNSFVESQPKRTWTTWWKQKLRHYSTASHYDKHSQIFLGLYHLGHLVFWISFLILICFEFSKLAWTIWFTLVLTKSILMLFYLKLFKVSKVLLIIWPILEASLLLLQLGLGTNGKFKKQKKW